MPQQPQKEARSLYHRWRSSTFAEVVGQEHVTRTLRNAVSRGRIVHAYLFCGPRGTGKTSTARILAKAVNCLDPQDGEPCNRCASCVAVSQGRAMDLIEIDAASNRGIDDARELRDKIKFSPSESRYRVYIIDEAHMLTSEASNALLKTLEEPPEHAILILATTESHKILATISSRCQRFDFRRIPLQTIVAQLRMICSEEGLFPAEGVLDRVARMARGSLRDAESLLDQLVAYCGETIELESAREVLGLTGEEVVPEFSAALQSGDLVRGFSLIDGLSSMGADLRHFARESVDYLRAILVIKTGAETSLTQEYRADELARLRSAAEGWSYRGLLGAIKAFGDLDGRMRNETWGQVHMEMAFMEAVLPPDASANDAIPPSVSQRETPVRLPFTPAQPLASRGSPATSPAPASELQLRVAAPQPAEVTEEPAAQASAASEAPAQIDLDFVKANWPRILSEVGASCPFGISAAFQGGHPIGFSNGEILLGFENKPLWKTTLERAGAREKVEAAFSTALGTRVAVRFQFGHKIKREVVPPDRDPVVETAVRELGFKVARVEPLPE